MTHGSILRSKRIISIIDARSPEIVDKERAERSFFLEKSRTLYARHESSVLELYRAT